MPTFKFTVDAALLRELGERLVGKPHIALAELIKNSYDADATLVEIAFAGDSIVVSDNGHGMSQEDFRTRWMRVGTTRKRSEGQSPRLARSMTGSKGVGRLAVQLLGRRFELVSVAMIDPSNPQSQLERGIRAKVNWDQAVQADELTSVEVPVEGLSDTPTFAGGGLHGTTITLDALTERWDRDSFASLAQELWVLQPPFAVADARQFKVTLTSDDEDVTRAFAAQMNAIFDIWNARIVGRLLPASDDPPRPIAMALPSKLPEPEDDELADGPREATDLRADAAIRKLPARYLEATVDLRGVSKRTVIWKIDHCELDELEFEIRVFDLVGRQIENVKVAEARAYLQRFGGVGIYDNGFRLPYYGADQDWLKIERDHGRRLDKSDLIPPELAVKRGLLDLPPNQRLFGWVAVSTSHEELNRRLNGPPEAPALSIQVTRDRLTDNQPLERMRVMLRAGLDLYAMEKARSKLPPPPSGDEPVDQPRASEKLKSLVETLKDVKAQIPATVYVELKTSVDEAIVTAESAEETAQTYAAILAALATAGMTSLAYEHEMSKQVRAIGDLSDDLDEIAATVNDVAARELHAIRARLGDWTERVQSIRQIFTPLLRKEVREKRQRLRAAPTIRGIADYLEVLANQAPVDTSAIPIDLYLPRATYPAWSSVIQNLLINSFNALHDEPNPRVVVDGGGDDRNGWIRVSDNGVGIDLKRAPRLWTAFERDLELPEDVEQAGLGGMGLGLAIVRMILDGMKVRAYFESPPRNMKTAVRIEWKGQR
jgi:signal transduction histidine kinase